MMISLTSENGISVRLDSAYDVQNETAEYRVACGKTRLYFDDFKEAASIFKSLREEILNGACEMGERLSALEAVYGRKEEA